MLALALAVIVGGLVNLRQLAIDAVPDISPKQVMVLTPAKGLGPLEVERLVTVPIENQMAGLPQVKDIRSTSRFGISAVYVTFEDGADEQNARGLVFQQLQQAQAMMPPGVGTPTEGPFATGLGEVLEFELRGPGYTPMQLYQMLQWKIAPQLKLVPGIVNVNIYGGKLQTYEIALSPGKLRALGVSVPQVFSAVEANNTARGGAYIEHGDEQQIVRGMALAETVPDIAGIVVKATPSGTPITIGDVATVRMAPQVRLGAVTHDGIGETVLGVADMQFGLNASEVLPALKAKIADVQKTLPPGVHIAPFYDRTDLIRRAISTVAHNLGEGAVLVVVVLVLMLGNLRAGLIVATIIPIAMMMAFAGMRALGISGNLMSLGALDFGLLVDGAVVLVENVLRRQSEGDGRQDLRLVVPKATAEVARPVMFSVLIITLVYVPVLSLQDIEGKTFRPMALTVMLALVAALIATILIVPPMAAVFLGRDAAGKDTVLVRAAKRGYAPVLRRAMGHPWITVGIAAGLFGWAVFGVLRLGGEFVPQLAEGAIVITSTKSAGINLDASLRIVGDIERVVRSFPDVRTVVSQTGAAAVPTDPMGVESTDSYAILKPSSAWTTADTQAGIQSAMEDRLKKAIPGVAFDFSQPIQMRMDDLLQGVRADVALTIFGHDLDLLRATADKAVALIKPIRGSADVRAETQGGLPALTIRLDRSRLSRYGIPADAALAVVEAIGGHQSGVVYGQSETETPVVVRLDASARTGPAAIGDLPVGMAEGQAVSLSSVADITVADGPASIERDKLHRRIDININVRGRDVQSFVAEAQRTVAQKLKLPPDFTLGWSGTFQNLQSASARLALVVPATMLAILVLLYLHFGDLRLALLIFLNVPMAATGGVAALVLRGMPFSVTAGIGFISVFGVAILDGVVLASYIGEERANGRAALQAARDAASKRLRPVLTTALVATIGFLPMAASTSAGAEVQRPLATVVIGGLISATVLTLLVLPALYPLVMEAGLPRRPRKRAGLRGAAAKTPGMV